MSKLYSTEPCDLNCPTKYYSHQPHVPKGFLPICCQTCRETKKKFLTDKNKDCWDDLFGFWSLDGCRLPRDKMPQVCIEYDCRKYRWLAERVWDGKGWIDNIVGELRSGEEIVILKREEKRCQKS